jgi:4-hydroxy-tetrahydrodipicolinate synthase
VRGTFRGSLVALPTPFRGGAIDYPALRVQVERLIRAGSDGLVPAGTTGEAAALDPEERSAVVAFTVGCARGRVPVLAGVGAGSTALTSALAREAEAAGADGVLVVTPPYSRPTQRGLAAHFGAVAAATRLPIVLYNVPARTAVDLLPETAGAIAAARPNVVAIKEASGSLERIDALVALGTLDVLCGEDAAIADCMQRGALGVIGVVANLAPRRVAELVRAAAPGGDARRAAELVEALAPLVRALFCETNPAPLKAALELMGLSSGELRLPLVPIAPESRERVVAALAAAGLGPPR